MTRVPHANYAAAEHYLTQQARDRAVERWLRDQVVPAYDALEADLSRAVTAEQVRARLMAERTRRKNKK